LNASLFFILIALTYVLFLTMNSVTVGGTSSLVDYLFINRAECEASEAVNILFSSIYSASSINPWYKCLEKTESNSGLYVWCLNLFIIRLLRKVSIPYKSERV
jgi:hypothetical protein